MAWKMLILKIKVNVNFGPKGPNVCGYCTCAHAWEERWDSLKMLFHNTAEAFSYGLAAHQPASLKKIP